MSRLDVLPRKTGSLMWQQRHRSGETCSDQESLNALLGKSVKPPGLSPGVSQFESEVGHQIGINKFEFEFRRYRMVSFVGKAAFKKQTKYECVKCKNDGHWLGQKLSLHIDHIDGNRQNNIFSNLRYLCPNCHAQTSTYCGRNQQRHLSIKNISDNQLSEAIKKSASMSETMRYLNLNPNNWPARTKIKAFMSLNNLKFKRSPLNLEQGAFDLLMASGIDFSKFGWVGQAAKILNIEPQSVSRWLKLRFPEFYEQNCFRRKLT